MTITGELFPTPLRMKGVGLVNFFGKLGCFLTSYIVFNLFYISKFLPFLSFSIINLISFIIINYLLKDTTNVSLDYKVISLNLE